jgi:hypothetical protein
MRSITMNNENNRDFEDALCGDLDVEASIQHAEKVVGGIAYTAASINTQFYDTQFFNLGSILRLSISEKEWRE